MLLDSIEIQRFRNFTEPQSMDVDPAVTCLLGKNESGKTTILQALHRLNPANRATSFELSTEYPRRHLARHRRAEDLAAVSPITARFSLEGRDIEAVGKILGFEPPEGTMVVAYRNYGNALTVEVEGDLATVVRLTGGDVGADPADVEELSALETADEVVSRAANIAAELKASGHEARARALGKIKGGLTKYAVLLDQNTTREQKDALVELLPKFFYFSEYEVLAGETDLEALAGRVATGTLEPGDETMIALLALAGQEPTGFLDEDYVTRKAELQAASADLSYQVMKYWKQNPALSVRFDTDMPIVHREPDGGGVRHRVLKIELHDSRHEVDTNFSTRSAGFQWFFSFLAAFSIYQDSTDRVVVLLDEPGLSLHGEAQRDFLRYIFDELGARQQVLYTTHSQHMLDPSRYETMRAVHDQATRENPQLGVVITPVALSADRTTILPFEAQLGYTVASHFFLGVGPHLLVEGSSDVIYLMRMSDRLQALGRVHLDPRISMVPVGGVPNMPAFVALMGRRLDVHAVIDGAETTKVAKKIFVAAEAAGVSKDKIVVLGEMDGLPGTADIEDLFTVKDYLWLYNRCGLPTVQEADLPPTGEPILRRIAVTRGEFDHAIVAHQLTADLAEFFAQADGETLDQFEQLFTKLPV